MQTKTKRITLNPREPLTRKARMAITAYVVDYGIRKSLNGFLLIDAILKAERMKRVVLYAWLDSHGYKWNGRYWLLQSGAKK